MCLHFCSCSFTRLVILKKYNPVCTLCLNDNRSQLRAGTQTQNSMYSSCLVYCSTSGWFKFLFQNDHIFRVPTAPGKPGKMTMVFPILEKYWNFIILLKILEKWEWTWKNELSGKNSFKLIVATFISVV